MTPDHRVENEELTELARILLRDASEDKRKEFAKLVLKIVWKKAGSPVTSDKDLDRDDLFQEFFIYVYGQLKYLASYKASVDRLFDSIRQRAWQLRKRISTIERRQRQIDAPDIIDLFETESGHSASDINNHKITTQPVTTYGSLSESVLQYDGDTLDSIYNCLIEYYIRYTTKNKSIIRLLFDLVEEEYTFEEIAEIVPSLTSDTMSISYNRIIEQKYRYHCRKINKQMIIVLGGDPNEVGIPSQRLRFEHVR